MKNMIKLSLIIASIICLTGCGNNKESTKSTQEQLSSKVPATNIGTVDNTKVETKNTLDHSARRDMNHSIGEQTPSLAALQDKPDLTTAGRNQPLMLQESVINDRIAYAVSENSRGEHFSALESLRAAVNESNFKSAKARYFLARQYQMMSQNGLKSDQAQSFQSSMQSHFKEAVKLRNQNLEIYPSNNTYADKSEKVLG